MDTVPIPLEGLGHAALDGLRQPVLAVDGARRIALRNQRARALLQESRWLCEYSGNRLHARDAIDDAALHDAIAQVVGGRRTRCAMRFASPAADAPELHASRIFATNGAPLALLAIFARRSMEEDAVELGAIFGLTPAEARVACYLAQGVPPKQVATTCGVSLCTVRTQIRMLFAKTGVRRQADLVRLLLIASFF